MSDRTSSRSHDRGAGGRGGRGGSSRGGRGRGHSHTGLRGRGNFAQHHQPRDSGYAARRHHNGPELSTMSQPHGSLCCDYVDENPPSSSADPTAAPYRCNFRTHSSLALVLHRADRHLIYPEGGVDELKRLDPMLIAEQREQQRRMRQNQRRQPHPLPTRPGVSSLKESVDDDESTDGETEDSDSQGDESESDDDDDNDSSSDQDDDQAPPKPSIAEESGRVLDGPADATISGLNIQLDSPELIAEWINQRKKRWPTQEVVQQKLMDRQERQKRSEAIYGPRPTPFGKRAREPEAESGPISSTAVTAESATDDKRQKLDAESDKHTGSAGSADAAAANDSDSDDDAAPEEISSKVAVPSLEGEATIPSPHENSNSNQHDRRPICTHFLQGRCNYGDRCRKRHETAPTASNSSSAPSQQQQQAAKSTRRPHPRPPPTNPFDQPDLLRQLLRNEIEKHVDAVGQAIRFIVDNDLLLHVETEEGQAEEQRRKRNKIRVLPSGADTTTQQEDGKMAAEQMEGPPSLSEPLVKGGLAVISSTSTTSDGPERSSLYRPPSPTLRALSELKYPPEPDPLIFLDPLRRDDPKPLLPSQLVRIAKDPVIRSVLTPSTPLHPNGHKPASLERAVISLDALPTDLYRNAAIEMILGIASSSTPASNPHHHGGGLVVTSKDGRRKVSETDLFRMGLRVGGDEVLAIKKLADRLSVLLDSSLQLDEVGESDWALLTAEQRDEMRKLHYEREADRLDRLRKLGIDV